MSWSSDEERVLLILLAARKVADLAREQGALNVQPVCVPHEHHMGAVLADAVLQAGLNYRSVVFPRVLSIVKNHPNACSLEGVQAVLDNGNLSEFLRWSHPTKLCRFSAIVSYLSEHGVQEVSQLRENIRSEEFRDGLLNLNGIGPKTIDYLSGLCGNDAVAVDRHIRSFALQSGVDADEYEFLKLVFSYAADLLSLRRRDLDFWVWSNVSGSTTGPSQLYLEI